MLCPPKIINFTVKPMKRAMPRIVVYIAGKNQKTCLKLFNLSFTLLVYQINSLILAKLTYLPPTSNIT